MLWSDYCHYLESSARSHWLKTTSVLCGLFLLACVLNAMLFHGENSLFYPQHGFNVGSIILQGIASFFSFSMLIVLYTLIYDHFKHGKMSSD